MVAVVDKVDDGSFLADRNHAGQVHLTERQQSRNFEKKNID